MGSRRRWTAEDIPDQSGKLAVVTGANSGLGLETTKALVERGAEVIMACRDRRRGQRALEEVKRATPKAEVSLAELDLADLTSVRSFAEAFLEEREALQLLINNAGVMAPPRRLETADGFELQIGTNHLGHFALTGLLLERLLETEGARVVTVSSQAHRGGRISFDDLHSERSYVPFRAYGQSKLANLLFTYELGRKLAEAGSEVKAAAAHPGWSATNLQSQSKLFSLFNPLFGQPASMGALPTLYAATAQGARSGDYFGPGGLGEMRGYPKKVDSNARSKDRAVAARLWDLSEELTGVSYEGLLG